MAKSLVILGTFHEVQGLPGYPGSVQDPFYEDVVLADLIAYGEIDYIFEEASGYKPSIAAGLAKPPIRYLDIDPSPDERPKLGVGLTKNSIPYRHDLVSCAWDIYIEAHFKRETVWLSKLETEHFEKGLVICGINHLLSFSFRLQSSAFTMKKIVEYTPRAKVCGHKSNNAGAK